MKLKNIFNLQKLYFLFISRRILSVGILKEKIFKVLIFIAIAVTITVSTVFLYFFLDDTDVSGQINFIYFVIKMQGVNIIVWTMIIFLFTRIIFLKKGDFLNITNQLPITHNERNSSFIFFELLMSLTIIFLISMAVIIAIVLRTDIHYIPLLICTVIFTSLTGYLLLQLINSIILYTLNVIKLEKVSSLVSILGFIVILVILYLDIVKSITNINYNTADFSHWSQFYIEMYSNYGFVVTFLIFVTISFLLLLFILYIPNNFGSEDNHYIKIKQPIKFRLTMFNLYILQISRRVENLTILIIAYFLAISLLFLDILNPLYAMFLVTTSGLYIYTQTDAIRINYYRFNYSAIKDYLNLITSQYIYILITSLPILILGLLINKGNFNLYDTLIIFGQLVLIIILATLIGILFPAKKDNPFSPFIGFLIMVIISGFISLILQFLDLSNLYNSILMLILYIFVIYISCLGLIKLKEEFLHEES
ncbi:hypothetical protein [Alkalihalobacillus pseudalcaliphilus]|uniref:hypothetical protein n=1 Tax=Alkalihalobacillus pseudalcaliphilus TaxID=79884 RepID=UPI002360254E|nr:hypothetical protein [Alkalihalobacillus pseudalcaliphilus]